MVIKGNNLNAILNYASKYDSVSQYLGTYDATALKTQSGSITAGDFAKIFFTGDGHIISHGIDYTPTFGDPNHSSKPLAKGLVPASTYAEGQKYKFLGNYGSWHELTVADLPMAQNFLDGKNPGGDKVIYSAEQVYSLFNDTISAVDAMRFRGGYTPGETSDFTSCEAGDTYRVNGPGTYAGITLQTGDLLICIKDSAAGATAADIKNPDNKYWMVVESNINGVTQHMVNGKPYTVYTDTTNASFDVYAPVTGGTAGYVLISNGDAAPEWKSASGLDLLSNAWKDLIVGTITVANNGNMTWSSLSGKTLGSYTPDITNHRWNINIAGKSAGTDFALTTGTGLAFAENKINFDGSEARQMILMPATRSAIGGVIIDNRTINPINNQEFKFAGQTISVNEDGMIYLTKDNISNALGFVPGSTENVYAYSQVVTSSSTAVSADVATNPFLNLTSQKENSTEVKPVASTQFVGTNGIKIDGQAGKIVFDLQEAKTDTYGGIKIFKKHSSDIAAATTSGSIMGDRYYGVELDNAGKAFVYVPWEDKNPAFNKIVVTGGANGTSGEIVAADRDSEFTLAAGNGINLVLTDPNKIIVNQDVWEAVKVDKMGYAPAMVAGNELTKAHYMLSFKEGDTGATWNKLPQAAFSDTWRAIQVNGNAVANTDAIDANGTVIGSALNFTATGDHNKTTLSYVASTAANTPHIVNIFSSWRPFYDGVKDDARKFHEDYSIVFGASDDIAVSRVTDASNETETVSFELVWYNIDLNTAETVQ